ncbi:MAG TPA: 3'-5' exonuclease, partial [Ktedonobacterales bacterium]
ERSGGQQITVHEAYNEEEEASYVVNEIQRLVGRGEAKRGGVAVMYRTNAQSRALEEQFLRAGVPYVVIGSKKFYDRKEIKDVLAYLRLIANPLDIVSLQRVVNVPARKIGAKTLQDLSSWAEREHMTPLEAIDRIADHPTLGSAGKRALASFGALFGDLRAKSRELPLPALIDFLLASSGYASELRDGSEEGEERWVNVLELRRVAEDFSEIEPDVALHMFLENVALVSGAETTQTGENGGLASDATTRDAVTLITLHAAKGLEFPVVFITGLEEGILPHSRSLESRAELEEERRLTYVGITRAMHRLYLVRAFRRTFYGGSSYQEASRFLDEIPEHLLHNTHQRERGTLPTVSDSAPSWGASTLPRQPLSGTQRPAQPARLMPDAPTWEEAQEAPSAAPVFRPGDKVMHRLFGKGTLLRIEEGNGATIVTVLFDAPQIGKKTLDLAFANLQKL